MENTIDLDPIEKLEETKTELTKQIASTKMLLNREKKKLTAIEKLNVEVVTDKNEKYNEQLKVITTLNDSLTELEIDLKELNRNKDDENEEKIQQALGVVMTSWLDQHDTAGYLIQDEEFIFIEDKSVCKEKQNVLVRTMPPKSFIELIAKDLSLKSWHLPQARVKDVFNDAKRTFDFARYTIQPDLWNASVYKPIQHLNKYFIDKLDLDDKYDEMFDCLMYSLSGGKQENQEHIEKWLLHKVINYDKAVTTPDIIIVGHIGGNGKGILMALVKQMLPSCLSGKANSKTLNGNFNAIMLGRLIVFFDDQESREISLESVKQLAGSETMIFEPKGKDQYEGEKTHSSAWFSQILPFPLTPAGLEGGVDRRFSVMATNITFLESIRLHMKQKRGTDVSVEESKDLAEYVVSNILLNRIEIGKWFKHLQKKHSEVNRDFTLKPLHGEDYHYFLDQQKTSFDTVWEELVYPILENGGGIPVFVIKEVLRHLDSKMYGDRTIHKAMKKLAAEYKVPIETIRDHIDITPSVLGVKKQCAFIRKIKSKSLSFDWTLVSNVKYCPATIGVPLIKEENLTFGVKSNKDDVDEEEIDEFDQVL